MGACVCASVLYVIVKCPFSLIYYVHELTKAICCLHLKPQHCLPLAELVHVCAFV